jgi:hypothetical protein
VGDQFEQHARFTFCFFNIAYVVDNPHNLGIPVEHMIVITDVYNLNFFC